MMMDMIKLMNSLTLSVNFKFKFFSQYGKAFCRFATPVASLAPSVNTPPYSHRFKSLLYTKTLAKWIS